MKSANSTTETWLMLLVLVLALAALLIWSGRREETATMPAFSTESPQPDGALGFFRLLGKYGIRSERLYEDVYFFPPRAEVVAFPPGFWVRSMDTDALVEWLDAGGRLVVLNENSLEASAVFTEIYGKRKVKHDQPTPKEKKSDSTPRGRLDEEPVYGGQFTRSLNEFVLQHPQEVSVTRGSSYSSDVSMLSLPVVRQTIFAGLKPSVTLKDGSALLIEMPVGKGKLIYMQIPEIATNQWIRRKDNARFLANILVENQTKGPIYFSEYYLGNRKIYPSPFFYMATTPAGWALIIVLSAAFLFFLNLASPFGRPRPEPVAIRRRSAEVLDAQANLYRRGNATGIAVANLVNGLKLAVMRARHLPRVPSLSYMRAFFKREFGTDAALGDGHDVLQDRRISHAELMSAAREVYRLTDLLKREESR